MRWIEPGPWFQWHFSLACDWLAYPRRCAWFHGVQYTGDWGLKISWNLPPAKSSRATGGLTGVSTPGLDSNVTMKAGVVNCLSFGYFKKVPAFSCFADPHLVSWSQMPGDNRYFSILHGLHIGCADHWGVNSGWVPLGWCFSQASDSERLVTVEHFFLT